MPALASSTPAAEAFSALRRRWSSASRAERKDPALEAYLLDLRERFSGQEVARQADLYLAWIALERGEYDRSHQLADRAASPHPGAVRLLAQLVDGVTLARSGEPEAALEKLRPLVGQLIDSYARDMLHEEAVIAAVTAHRWDDALWLLDVWLRDVPEDDRATVLDVVRAQVTLLPADALEKALLQRLGSAEHMQRAEALDRVLARRLAQLALETQDSGLARRLLERPGVLPLLGDQASPLLELASHFDVPQVNGRLIGLHWVDQTPSEAERGAQVSLGVLESLGLLTGPPPGTDRPGVVVRQGSAAAMPQALAALDTEGVSVIIGGLDAASAKELARFAVAEQIATVLLTPPDEEPASPWVFQFGPDPREPSGALREALEQQGARRVAIVGAARDGADGLERACVGLPPTDQLTRYPVDDWKRRGVDGLVLLGSPRCSREALDEARGVGLTPRVALGPESAELLRPLPTGSPPTRRAVVASAHASLGCYPGLSAGGEPRSDAGYWRQLARDVALSTALALSALPADLTLDAAEVRRRREQVRATLAQVPPSVCLGLRPLGRRAPSPWRIAAP